MSEPGIEQTSEPDTKPMHDVGRKPTIAVLQGPYEPCEECGAPLDPQQRYCVNCAARRSNGANPSSRYFAAMSKKARRPLTQARRKAASSGRAAAVGFFALLPIAVALGVVVGRSGSDSGESEAILRALRNQEAATASTAAGVPASRAAGAKKDAATQAKASQRASKPREKVVEKTSNGTVHQVTGFHPSKRREQEDTKLVEHNPEQTGENYIKAQQHLPDVIVVGGSGGSAGSTGTGAKP